MAVIFREVFFMGNNSILYMTIMCPLGEARNCINRGSKQLKSLIDYLKGYGDDEGITFLELTEDSLKNLPPLMVDNMRCFTSENINTMAFYIKHMTCKKEDVENLKSYLHELMEKLLPFGFYSELVFLREVRYLEENAGKTVGKKEYELYCHMEYK